MLLKCNFGNFDLPHFQSAPDNSARHVPQNRVPDPYPLGIFVSMRRVHVAIPGHRMSVVFLKDWKKERNGKTCIR